MILLEGQQLDIKTSTPALTDVYVTYMDRGVGATPMGNVNFTTSAIGVSNLVPSPAASVMRTVRMITVKNRDVSSEQIVSFIPNNGVTAIEPISFRLLAGDMLMYHELAGFSIRDWQGQPRTATASTETQAAVNALNLVVLPSDVINNNAVANTMQDITGLSFPVVAGQGFYFRFTVAYSAAATSTGSRWSINGPAITLLRYHSEYSLTATTRTFGEGLSAYNVPAACNATSAATAGNIAVVDGFIIPSASGTIIGRFASEVASSAITANRGSILEWIRVV